MDAGLDSVPQGKNSIDDCRVLVHEKQLPTGFPYNPRDGRFVELAQRGLTLGQIREILRGHDSAVLSRCADFLVNGWITILRPSSLKKGANISEEKDTEEIERRQRVRSLSPVFARCDRALVPSFLKVP